MFIIGIYLDLDLLMETFVQFQLGVLRTIFHFSIFLSTYAKTFIQIFSIPIRNFIINTTLCLKRGRDHIEGTEMREIVETRRLLLGTRPRACSSGYYNPPPKCTLHITFGNTTYVVPVYVATIACWIAIINLKRWKRFVGGMHLFVNI